MFIDWIFFFVLFCRILLARLLFIDFINRKCRFSKKKNDSCSIVFSRLSRRFTHFGTRNLGCRFLQISNYTFILVHSSFYPPLFHKDFMPYLCHFRLVLVVYFATEKCVINVTYLHCALVQRAISRQNTEKRAHRTRHQKYNRFSRCVCYDIFSMIFKSCYPLHTTRVICFFFYFWRK